MNGNWYGPYAGTNSGQIVVEIDDRGDHFEGCAYAYDSNWILPSTFAVIKTLDKKDQIKFEAPLFPLDPQTAEPTDWDQVAKHYSAQNIVVPKKATVECEYRNGRLKLKWATDIGTNGSTELARNQAGESSACKPLPINSWKEFKEHVTKLENYRFIFRGQSSTRRLRTPFHRTGRGDLRRFFMQDIPVLHRSMSARTEHVFDLSNPLQNAAFLNLVQHHGYPTPLLDWTYSPFVGAFFAYHRIKASDAANAGDDEKVRIFMFDKSQWCADIKQILSSSVRWPHFSIVEPIAIGNERLIPQQALSSYSTADDIETYIASKETAGKKYLEVIDLPKRARTEVMRELSLMGVTAGSLFPGFDGTCEEIRERFFSL